MTALKYGKSGETMKRNIMVFNFEKSSFPAIRIFITMIKVTTSIKISKANKVFF